MDKAALLIQIQEAFEDFKTKNNAFPRYRGLTEMLVAMIQLLDGSPGSEDLSAIRQRLDELAAQLAAIDPGMPEADVRALLATAVAALDAALQAIRADDIRQDADLLTLRDALQQLTLTTQHLANDFTAFKTADAVHEGQQNAAIQQVRDQLAGLANPADIEALANGLTQVQNDLATHRQQDDTRDARQDADINRLQEGLSQIPVPATLNKLISDLDALRTNLQGHVAQDDTRDGRQDGDISQLRTQLALLPSAADLAKLISDLAALRDRLNSHVTQDDTRDTRQDADISRLRTDFDQFPAPEQLGQLLSDLAQLRDRLQTHITQDDTRDGRQDTDINQLRRDLAQIPAPAELSALLTSFGHLREKLDRHLIQDDGRDARQDDEIRQLKALLAKIPTPEALGTLLTDLASLRDRLSQHVSADDARDTRQDASIKRLEEALAAFPAAADVAGLVTGLQGVQEKLNSHLAQDDKRDAQQDKDIDQLQQEVRSIAVLKADLLTARTDIAANFQHDEKQDWAIAQLNEDFTKLPSVDKINQVLVDLEKLRKAFEAHQSEDDARDARQDREIQDLRNNPADPDNPTPPDDNLRQLRADFDRHKEEDDRRDTRQDASLGELESQLGQLPSRAELEQILHSLNGLMQAFEAYKGQNDATNGRQQSEIDTLGLNFEAYKGQNDATNGRQQAEIDTLGSNVEAHKAQNDTRHAQQQAELDALNTWRQLALSQLQQLQDQLGGLSGLKPEFDALKIALQDALAQLERSIRTELDALKELPARLSDLEILVRAIQPGLNEARVIQIASERDEAVRLALEARLSQWETTQGQQLGTLELRLKKAEEDILRLFQITGPGGGTGDDGVGEDYVKAAVDQLDRTLRDLIRQTDDKYAGLLSLAGIVSQLQAEMTAKISAAQAAQLIADAVNGLATRQSLTDLETRLRAQWASEQTALRASLLTEIRLAYEAFFNQKLTDLDLKLSQTETRLLEAWTRLLQAELAKIWEGLPQQSLPDNWLQLILQKAAELDVQLEAKLIKLFEETWHAAILLEVRQLDSELEARLVQLFEQNWRVIILGEARQLDSELEARLLAADETLRQSLLDELNGRAYASAADLEALKVWLLADVKTQIEDFAQGLPPILSKEDVQAVVEAEMAVLSTSLTERLQALESLNTAHRLTTLEQGSQQLSNQFTSFQTFINGLSLVNVIAMVNGLESWKQSLQPQLQELRDEVDALRQDLAGSAATDTAQRLARLCLQGWGVVGGLEVYSDKDYCIHLSAGQGVTPDGHLLVLPQSASFIGYQVLPESDKKELRTRFFDTLPTWELIPVQEEKSIDGQIRRWLTPQTNQERDMPFSSDKVLLLLPGPRFLLIRVDDYLKKTNTFENLRQLAGGEREFEYADYLFTSAFSPVDNPPTDDNLYRAFNPALLLPPIPLYRFGFKPGDDCTTEELDETNFPDKLSTLRDFYDTWKPIITEALTLVNEQTSRLLAEYHPVLFPQLPVAPFQRKLKILLSNWKAYTRLAERPNPASHPDLNWNPEMCYAQYFYDWARDLINAYHECRNELQTLLSELCLLTPEALSLRSQHLCLGAAWRPDQDGLAAPLRDTFRQPPIYNGYAERWERTRLYYRRLFELMESFYLAGALPNDSLPAIFRREDDDPFEPDFSHLKITPGKHPGHPLGQQSIPFYYPLGAGPGSLHYCWDYHRTKTRTYDQHLSYHASDYDDSYNNPDDWHITRPLYYTLDQADFYRVEGFIGKKEVPIIGKDEVPIIGITEKDISVVAAIEYLIKKHNLDIKVIPKLLSTTLSELHKVEGFGATHSFPLDILGAEHLGGVPRGGTLIIVLDAEGVAVADFSVPYKI